MTIQEAIHARHVVRKYLDKPLPVDVVKLLDERIAENNRRHGISMKLVVNDGKAVPAFFRLLFHAKGVNNYLILSGADTPDTDRMLGYAGIDVMLYAQTLGLNTWWSASFSRSHVKKSADGTRISGIIAIGYGDGQGVPHKSKTIDEVSRYEGDMPEWFVAGVKSALLAPTALNRQAFMLVGEGHDVSLSYRRDKWSETNIGIIKYCFEVGAGIEHFAWKEISSI